MAFITQHIVERKQNVVDIIEDAYYDRLRAAPGMTLRESFESRVDPSQQPQHVHLSQIARRSSNTFKRLNNTNLVSKSPFKSHILARTKE
jgi:hypothetical protein